MGNTDSLNYDNNRTCDYSWLTMLSGNTHSPLTRSVPVWKHQTLEETHFIEAPDGFTSGIY